jgi:hypothetical protein
MILISHRGNIDGRCFEKENHPSYIDEAIFLGYDVEVDLWSMEGNLFLGHDIPQYKIPLNFLKERKKELWIHCKNIECVEIMSNEKDLNWFWHEEDTITLTSKNFIWAYPGKQPILNSIAVMPEMYNDIVTVCIGICSDYINKYKL